MLPSLLPAKKTFDIPAGWRAYTLETDAVTAQNAAPGGRVDILMGFDAVLKTGGSNYVVATILQRVLVIDTVRAEGKNGLVLMLAPDDAQYLLLAENENIKVVFRRPDDAAAGPIQVSVLSNLF